MVLDPTRQNAIRERLSFYRELGIGPLYRRDLGPAASPRHGRRVGRGDLARARRASLQETVARGNPLWPGDDDRRAEACALSSTTSVRTASAASWRKLGRKQIVFGTGDPNAELMFIGEGPGADEDAQGLPFVGRAGQLLNNMITAMGLRREQVYIANIVKCRPPGNRTPERDECDTCSPFLMRQIRVVRPKVIVALGATAAKNLLGLNDSMASLRGRFYDFSPRGSLMDAPFDCKLAVTYHPAFLLRDPRQKAETWKDCRW